MTLPTRLLRPPALFLAASLFAQSSQPLRTPPPSPTKVRVTIVVTLEDSPCLGGIVEIKPMGPVEEWPEGKTQLTLNTDVNGRASVLLGPGKYLAMAHDSLHTKLPADGWFRITPNQRQAEKIHLNLLYWDCAHVTCML